VIEFRESFYENNHCMSFACDTFFNMQKTKDNGGLSKCWDCMKELLATFLHSFLFVGACEAISDKHIL
jgi:hypothetical protein